MKSLRILTGHHAGVQTQLKQQSYSIGNNDDSDIQIIDWKHAPVVVEINDEGKVTILTKIDMLASINTSNSPTVILDFMPHRFGDIVLCVGPVAATWPSDLSILGRLSWPKIATRQRFSPIFLTAGSIIAATLVMISAVASDSVRSVATAKSRATASLLAQVENALITSGADGLVARKAERGVQIDGTAADSAAVIRLRAALDQFDSELVFHRYGIATDIIRAINDAVSTISVQVNYKGAGTFLVTGHTSDLDRLLSTIQRIRSDLGLRIARIDVNVVESTVLKGNRTSAVMVSGGIQYVEAANGTKHFSVITPIVDINSTLQPMAEPSPTLSLSSKKMDP